jgi:hypothetical protein
MPIDGQVLTLDEAMPPMIFNHCDKMRLIAWTRGQAAKTIDPARLLRPRGERSSSS